MDQTIIYLFKSFNMFNTMFNLFDCQNDRFRHKINQWIYKIYIYIISLFHTFMFIVEYNLRYKSIYTNLLAWSNMRMLISELKHLYEKKLLLETFKALSYYKFKLKIDLNLNNSSASIAGSISFINAFSC